MPSEPDLRTRFAIEANDLADALNAALGTIRLRPAGYKPELTRPEGVSTGGGVQSMQHLRLVPQVEGKRALIVGSANRTAKRAELRSYDQLDAQHREQFDEPVDLDRDDYEQFLAMAASLLLVLRLDTSISGQPSQRNPTGDAIPRKRFIALGFGLALLLVAAAFAGHALFWR